MQRAALTLVLLTVGIEAIKLEAASTAQFGFDVPSVSKLTDTAKSAATDQATSAVGTDLVDSATSV